MDGLPPAALYLISLPLIRRRIRKTAIAIAIAIAIVLRRVAALPQPQAQPEEPRRLASFHERRAFQQLIRHISSCILLALDFLNSAFCCSWGLGEVGKLGLLSCRKRTDICADVSRMHPQGWIIYSLSPGNYSVSSSCSPTCRLQRTLRSRWVGRGQYFMHQPSSPVLIVGAYLQFCRHQKKVLGQSTTTTVHASINHHAPSIVPVLSLHDTIASQLQHVFDKKDGQKGREASKEGCSCQQKHGKNRRQRPGIRH